jgi:uncharacterized repeat protein (TIGR01451 family)
LALVAVFLIKGLTFFCICRNFYIFGRNITAMNLAKYCYQIAPKGLGIFCFIFLLCFSSSSFSQQMHAFVDDAEINDIAFEGTKVWVLTQNSLVCYDTISGQKTFYNYSNCNLGYNANSIEVDNFGNKLIISSNGLDILNVTNQWTHISDIGGYLVGAGHRLNKDRQGRIWLTAPSSTLKYFIWENQNFSIHDLWSSIVPGAKAEFDNNNNLYFTSSPSIIYKVDSLNNITVIHRDSIGLLSVNINDISVNSDGTIWVSYTDFSHFSKISPNGIVTNFNYASFGMSFDSISYTIRTYQHNDDIYFFNAAQSGLFKSDGINFSHLVLNPSNNLHLQCIGISGTNTLYMGGGMYYYEVPTFLKYNNGIITGIDLANSGLVSNSVNAIEIDYDGNKWIGTAGGGLLKFDGTSWVRYSTQNSALLNNSISNILVAHDNVVWFSDGDFVGKIDNGIISYVSNFTFNLSAPSTIIEDKFNNIWVHGYGGLYKFDGITWNFYSSNTAGIGPYPFGHYSIVADTLGNIWGGTSSAGLFKFGTNNLYSFYPNATPTVGDPIWNVYCDKQNNIYFQPHLSATRIFNGATFSDFTVNGSAFGFTHRIQESDTTALYLSYNGIYRVQGNNALQLLNGDKLDYAYYFIKDNSNTFWIANKFEFGLLCFNPTEFGPFPFTQQPSSSLSGKVYFDQNQNGIAEVGDAGLPWKGVKNNTNNTVVYTNTNGNFVQYLANGDYVIQENFQAQSNFILTSDSVSYHVSLNQSNATNLNFGAFTDAIEDSIIVNFSPGLVRCNTTVNNWITITNYSVFPFTGDVNLQFDDSLGFSFNNIQGTLNGNTATWHIDSLMPFQSMTISFITQNPTVGFINNIPNGTIDYSLSVTNPNILYSSNHSYNLLCSYDPNFKEVNPPGVGFQNHTLQNTPLEYTLHFQNMGNDTAFHVLVTDTLSSLLNPETFEYIAASHTVNITRVGNILKFDFPHINLLPKSMNEPLSQGFVKFRIKTFENLPDYSILNNTANIYFDFNPAVITNTSLNTLVYELDANVEELSNLNNQVLVYPNPANKILTIDLQNINIENCIITNALGQTVYNSANEINVNHKIQLNISNLRAGVYFVKVRSGNGSYTAKFVKAE